MVASSMGLCLSVNRGIDMMIMMVVVVVVVVVVVMMMMMMMIFSLSQCSL